jgi:hypothetical protein
MSLDRRAFLKSGAVAAAGASAHKKRKSAPPITLQADGALQFAVSSDPAARLAAVPFHGKHQAGITNPPPPAACFAALDVTATDTRGLAELFQTITARARFLTAGGYPRLLGITAPPPDSGTLGGEVVADGLTVTLGVWCVAVRRALWPGEPDAEASVNRWSRSPTTTSTPIGWAAICMHADVRRLGGHGSAHVAGHPQAQPWRRHAGPLADGRVRIPAAAVGRTPQPPRVPRRNRKPRCR